MLMAVCPNQILGVCARSCDIQQIDILFTSAGEFQVFLFAYAMAVSCVGAVNGVATEAYMAEWCVWVVRQHDRTPLPRCRPASNGPLAGDHLAF